MILRPSDRIDPRLARPLSARNSSGIAPVSVIGTDLLLERMVAASDPTDRSDPRRRPGNPSMGIPGSHCKSQFFALSVYSGTSSGQSVHFSSAFSIAVSTSFESGVSLGLKRAITSPLRLTRNLVKFQGISPANLGLVSLLVKYW